MQNPVEYEASSLAEGKGRQIEMTDKLQPERTALIVVDVQNEFCSPDGPFASLGHDLTGIDAMTENISSLVAAAREVNALIIFVRATYDEVVLGAPLAETYYRRGFINSQCLEGSWEADWYGGIEPNPKSEREVAITKHRFSAFWGTPIDLYLRCNDIRTVLVTGVVSSGCVATTAHAAFFNDYYSILVKDAISDPFTEYHDATVAKFHQAFGAATATSDITAIWKSLEAPVIEAKEREGSRDVAAALSSAKKALVLLDFVEGETRGTDSQEAYLLSAASQLLDAARKAGILVIHVRSSLPDLAARPHSLVDCPHMAADVADYLPPFEPRSGEVRVTKHRASAFQDSSLGLVLRANDIATIVVCGTEPAAVVRSAASAQDLDYDVVLPSDGIGYRACRPEHRQSLMEFAAMEVAAVVNAEEVLQAWNADDSLQQAPVV